MSTDDSHEFLGLLLSPGEDEMFIEPVSKSRFAPAERDVRFTVQHIALLTELRK